MKHNNTQTIIKVPFPTDGSIRNRNNLVQVGLAFPGDRFHLELMLESCTGDICLAGVQDSRRGAPITFFELRSLPIRIHLKSFYPFPQAQFQLGPNSETTDYQSPIEPFQAFPWKHEAYPYRECHSSSWRGPKGPI